ncbi:pentapeptide repeat-containing protein [Spiroplasma citri]|uniref:Pentapeptide repeat-containing protein n=1 Tax=Spiroplasma citri TaxID=2133 RepID=A0AAX3SWA1_SPICI|nr:pentapeptide repeat-containing protein [Spiroplasma citri]WFG95452.1 pentapeptide repeat-containing protein [Spiroplasma citri]
MKDLTDITVEQEKINEYLENEVLDLRGADLKEANLRGADLRGAYLKDAKLIIKNGKYIILVWFVKQLIFT